MVPSHDALTHANPTDRHPSPIVKNPAPRRFYDCPASSAAYFGGR